MEIMMFGGRKLLALVMALSLVAAGCTSLLETSPEEGATQVETTQTAVAQEEAVTTTTDSPQPTPPPPWKDKPPTTTENTTTTVTIVQPTTTTTAVLETTTTTVYYADTSPYNAPEPFEAGGAGGSGCAPGQGPLPDGVWFGTVTVANATSLQFDLQCWYVGQLAIQVAAAHGDPPPPNEFYIVNDNPSLRTVPVTIGTVVHHIDASLNQAPMPYAAWLLGPLGFLECPYNNCLLWIYVNGGEVTEIVEQYTP